MPFVYIILSFPGSSADKESTCSEGDRGSIPGWEDTLEKGQATHSNILGLPSGSDSKEFACNVGGLGSVPGLRRSPGEGNGYPLQYSCLENPHGQRSLAGYSSWYCKNSDMTE